MNRCLSIILALGILWHPATVSSAATAQSRAASITLKAKWAATSTLLETAEFMAEEEGAAVWKFIDSWHSQERRRDVGCWDQIASVASSLLSPAMTKVLQVTLGIRKYSSLLEVHRSQAELVQHPKGACAFVDLGGGRVASSPEELTRLVEGSQLEDNAAAIHDFDIIYPSPGLNLSADATTAILYGSVGTSSFWNLHQVLAARASQTALPGGRALRYVYRPVLLEGCSGEAGEQCSDLGTGDNLQLPGFGVEMAVKNMEYSAMDEKAAVEGGGKGSASEGSLDEVRGFDLARLTERRPELKQELLGFRDHLLASSSAEETLKVWDLKDLGLQATQRIAQASDPLKSLADFSQNFPNLASVLSRSRVEPSLRAELQHNQKIIPGGTNLMLLNGMFVDPESNIYDLVDSIRKEVRLAEQLQESRLEAGAVAALLALRPLATSDDEEPRIDLTKAGQVVYLNDLERDREYVRWDRSVMDLLRVFPGMLPKVRRNLFNVICIVDPATPKGLGMVEHAVGTVKAAQWPVRIGLLLAPKETRQRVREQGAEKAGSIEWGSLAVGEKVAVLFSVLQKHAGGRVAGDFLVAVHTLHDWEFEEPEAGKGEATLEWDLVEEAFERTARKAGGLEGGGVSVAAAVAMVEGGPAALLSQQAAALDATGVGSMANSMWMNGARLPDHSRLASPQAKMGYGLQMEMQRLQEMIYYGQVTDAVPNMEAFLLAHFKALPRFNPRINASPTDATAAPRQLPLVGGLAPGSATLASLGYLHHPGTEEGVKTVTHWVVVDVAAEEGRDLLTQALQYLKSEASSSSRLAIILRSTLEPRAPSFLEKTIAAANLLPARRSKIPNFLLTLLAKGCETEAEVLAVAQDSGLNSKSLGDLLKNDLAAVLEQQSTFSRKWLKLPEGGNAVVTNGRVLSAQSPGSDAGERVIVDDFSLLDHFASNRQLGAQIGSLLEDAILSGRALLQHPSAGGPGSVTDPDGDLPEETTTEQVSDAALLASSVLAAYLANDPIRVQGQAEQVAAALSQMQREMTGFQVAGGAGSGLSITSVLNPLSKTAQQLSTILDFLRTTLQPSMKVFLNPQADLSSLPLKSYYRLAMPTFLASGAGLSMPGPPSAEFAGLPSTKVLTLHMDVPEAWLVEPVRAAHDLDNLRLSDLGPGQDTLAAEFELEAILLTGRCADIAARTREQSTPRGVQLYLGSGAHPHQVDTLVMSNLGYFQLKAGPGVYNLSLASGRSQLLYGVVQPGSDLTLKDSAAKEVQLPVAISSMQGKHQQLILRKQDGYEDADVLDELDSTGGMLDGVAKWLSGGKGKKGGSAKGKGQELSPEDDPDTIHIFTVASGHMYERLQKIMVLSMIRNTKNRVKVWFIKNYMSPQMKRFLPHMAEHYGFDYEFVTYKWPSWLHKQTDKQRIIWAYKILFLDVLFPLNLRKVIFVDSDQIIRADFAELWNMDLQGAPLAYTPFCDNNKDMDGFRFWKQGFWQSHLKERPYHISALYVVDLAKFRQMAAGDHLRILYEQLSKDPNSLANLDQDLPNYAQHQVPIFSLPQEWLWCETWCGNSTKSAAKTIDLCNNPLTKEPKLQAARRIAPEWSGLDAEAQAFTAAVEERLAKQAQEAGGTFERGELSLSSGRQEELLTEGGGISSGGGEVLEEAAESPSDAPDSAAVSDQNSGSELPSSLSGDRTEL